MEINFEDYLSEEERKQIVAEVFRSRCQKKFEKDAERIFENAAYGAVFRIVDEMHDGQVAALVAEKAKRLIDELSVYSVFRKADAWERGESEGHKALNQAIFDNKQVLNNRILAIIEKLGEHELREVIKEQAMELLDSKLFGKLTNT